MGVSVHSSLSYLISTSFDSVGLYCVWTHALHVQWSCCHTVAGALGNPYRLRWRATALGPLGPAIRVLSVIVFRVAHVTLLFVVISILVVANSVQS